MDLYSASSWTRLWGAQVYIAHVLKGSQSFTCTPRVHPLTEWTIPALPSRSWSSFTGPGGMAGSVGLGDWLHTEINVRHWELNLDTITHPSTNRARRKLTLLVETNALPLLWFGYTAFFCSFAQAWAYCHDVVAFRNFKCFISFRCHLSSFLETVLFTSLMFCRFLNSLLRSSSDYNLQWTKVVLIVWCAAFVSNAWCLFNS